MCGSRNARQRDWNQVEGRRVVPNAISRELFSKVDFFKYIEEEESKKRYPWLRRNSTKTIDGAAAERHEQWNRKYASNKIRTTRYTWWNFVPIALFSQFTKVVNCFYAFNFVLQTFPSISTNEPQNIATVLMILVLIGMGKELVADLKRYKTDKTSNQLPTQLVTGRLLDKKPQRRTSRPEGSNEAYSKRLDQLD